MWTKITTGIWGTYQDALPVEDVYKRQDKPNTMQLFVDDNGDVNIKADLDTENNCLLSTSCYNRSQGQ